MNIIPWDGKPISKPGIYANVPMSAYHGQLTIGPSLSKSGAQKIVGLKGSPAHYYDTSYLNPDREEDTEESEALVLGRGTHHLILGEADFQKHFAVEPETYTNATGDEKAWNNNATFARIWKAEQEAAGRTILKWRHLEQIRGMAGGLMANPLVRAGALNGLIEHTLVYQDKETGVWVKVRPDAIPTDSGDIADLKTAADISDEGIERSIGDLGYNVQGAMIGSAWRAILDRPMSSFSLVFIEKKRPHCCQVRTLIDGDLELGERQARTALRIFARCIDKGYWPGPSAGGAADGGYAQMREYTRKAIEFRLQALETEMKLD